MFCFETGSHVIQGGLELVIPPSNSGLSHSTRLTVGMLITQKCKTWHRIKFSGSVCKSVLWVTDNKYPTN